ncbi:hypothetical protein D3C75_1198200 [compost metagenome]
MRQVTLPGTGLLPVAGGSVKITLPGGTDAEPIVEIVVTLPGQPAFPQIVRVVQRRLQQLMRLLRIPLL